MGTYGDATEIKNRADVDKDDLNLTQPEFDTLVTSARNNASEAVEDYCQRDFEKHTTHVDKLDGNGRDTIRLRAYPVLTLTEVKIDGDVEDASEYRLKPSPDLPDRMNSGILEKKSGVWPKPDPDDWENIEVTYDYGFDPTPEVVNDIVNDLAVRDLLDFVRNVQVRGATQISLEGFSMGFGTEEERQRELTDDHKDKLEPYRQIVTA